MKEFISGLPKAELHLHIEGTLEPELMFALAKRNQIKLPYQEISEVKAAYQFADLQSFLKIYYQATQVLLHEEDFFDLTWEYIKRINSQNVQHVEVFFDPQTHLARNVAFETVISGITHALKKAKQEFNISSHVIACFLRDLSEENALGVFEKVCEHQDKIIGIGLDSAEKDNPPSKFKELYARAKTLGFHRVAHAGEEGPPAYIWEAIEILDAQRIDHGIRCIEDPVLVNFLVARNIPLTLCPLSNVRLQVVEALKDHPIKILLEKNLCVTINSDDPAYFGGYIDTNYQCSAEVLNFSKDELTKLAENSFKASFLDEQTKMNYLRQIQHYLGGKPIAC